MLQPAQLFIEIHCPNMDVSIKQGGSKQIKLKWNSYEGAAYYTVFYVKGSFHQTPDNSGNTS